MKHFIALSFALFLSLVYSVCFAEASVQDGYIGQQGYAVIAAGARRSVLSSLSFDEEDWLVDTFRMDGNSFVQEGTLPHKTEVLITDRVTDENDRVFFLCQIAGEESPVFINSSNITIEPYWTYDVLTASGMGIFTAEYHRSGSYYPVDANNSAIKLEPGAMVIVLGRNDFNGCGGPKKEQYPIKILISHPAGQEFLYEEYFVSENDLIIREQ